MKKILIIQARPGIGDYCVFLPVIKKISTIFNDHKIHIITSKRSHARELISYNDSINKIFYLPLLKKIKKNIWIYNLLKKEKYDKCFIFHYGLRFFLLSKLAGIKKVFFYGIQKKNENIVKKAQTFLKKSLNLKNLKLDLPFNLKKNKKKNQIILGIGGSGYDKKWKIDNFLKLGLKINKIKKVNFILAGGKKELTDANYLQKNFKKYMIKSKSLCNMKIKDTLAFLASSKLYIGNDTGFMHLSGCLGIKSYGIFGPTSTLYASYNKKIIPISASKKKEDTKDKSNINFISSDYVLRHINLKSI